MPSDPSLTVRIGEVSPSCVYRGCRFTAVGQVVLERDTPHGVVRHRLPVCAVDRDDLVRQGIDSPRVARVVWHPRRSWSDDRASS